MIIVKPSQRIWSKINGVLLDENAAEVLVTLIDGMCSLLVSFGAVANDEEARVHLAAMLLSPGTHPEVGSLAPRLEAEFERLRAGK